MCAFVAITWINRTWPKTNGPGEWLPGSEVAICPEILQPTRMDVMRSFVRLTGADGLDEFLADGFKVLEPDGSVRTKKEEITWLRETPPDEEPSDFIFTIKEILLATDSIAVVYGRGDSTRESEDGQPCHHNYSSSNTFTKQDGAWKPVFSHISGITCTRIE